MTAPAAGAPSPHSDGGALRALRFAPAATWAGAIAFASSFDWSALRWPKEPSEGLGIGRWLAGGVVAVWQALALPVAPDKAVHALIFGLLAVLLALPSRLQGGRRIAVAWALAVAWGALDEVHQAFVPGRSSDGWDLLADAVGSALALSLIALYGPLWAGVAGGARRLWQAAAASWRTRWRRRGT